MSKKKSNNLLGFKVYFKLQLMQPFGNLFS